MAVGGDADAGGPVEFAGSAALDAELGHEDTLRGEDLDAVVPRVGDDDVALLVDSYAVRAGERPVFASLLREMKSLSNVISLVNLCLKFVDD